VISLADDDPDALGVRHPSSSSMEDDDDDGDVDGVVVIVILVITVVAVVGIPSKKSMDRSDIALWRLILLRGEFGTDIDDQRRPPFPPPSTSP
jgi:hypothetical protein